MLYCYVCISETVTTSSERVDNSLLHSDWPYLFSTSLVLFTTRTLMLGIVTANYVPVIEKTPVWIFEIKDDSHSLITGLY